MNEELIGFFSEEEIIENEMKFEEKQINDPHQKRESAEELSGALGVIKVNLEGLRSEIKRMFYSVEELREIPSRVLNDISLLELTTKKEIIHHHHTAKTLWISVALFIAICLMSCAWYMTYERLNLYKANDTKYRYLKLESNKNVNKTISSVDSLFHVNEKMRDEVIRKEEVNQRNLEMLQRAMQLEKEVKELKQKAKVRSIISY